MTRQQRAASFLLLLITNNLFIEIAGRANPGQCLKGWGAVLGMSPALVNQGLNGVTGLILPGSQLNGVVTIPFSDLPITVTARFNNVRLGRITLTPIRAEFRAANLRVNIVGGSITVNFGDAASTTKDMTNAEINLETSVRSYRNIVTNSGVRYDLSLYIKDEHAVRGFSMDASLGTRHFLADALEIKLKELLSPGSSYHVLSFTIPDRSDDTRRFIPSTVDYTFNFDHSGRGKHVFSALMTMPGMSVPTHPHKYIFGNEELMSTRNAKLTFTIENHFLLSFLVSEIRKVPLLRHLDLRVVGGCPGSIQLAQTVHNFTSGADLEAFNIEVSSDKGHLHFIATKYDATPGVHAHIEYNSSFSLSYNAGRIVFTRATQHQRKWTTTEDWLIPIHVLTLGVSAIITYAIVIPIVHSKIPSVFEMINGMLSRIHNGMQFKVGSIVLNRITSSQFKTDSSGNLLFGVISSQ